MDECYADRLTDEEWEVLYEVGAVRRGPASVVPRDLKSEVVERLLCAGEPFDEKTAHASSTRQEVSELWGFLSSGDDGKPKLPFGTDQYATELLKVVLTHLASDEKALAAPVLMECVCGKQHRIVRAEWLAELREREWVPGHHGHLEKPSAANLSRLVGADRVLMDALESSQCATMLDAVGVSPTEIMRRQMSDPGLRAHVELMASSIYRRIQENPAVAGALGAALRDDHAVESLLKQAETNRQVAVNQSIGSAVERALDIALSDAGLNVERTGVGSDFDVECDFTDNGEEVRLRTPNKWLIEVKTTQGNEAKMTPRQVKEAIDVGVGFWLCVVKRPAGTTVDADLVRTLARFVQNPKSFLDPVQGYIETLDKATSLVENYHIDGVAVRLTESQVRVAVSERHWDAGIALDEFVTRVKAASSKSVAP